MNVEQIKITPDGIAHLLADKNLTVPIYQRSYAWEEQHVQMLFEDLANAIRSKTTTGSYFLGSIVALSKTGSQHEIVDGQQRLATTSILIAAIRDYYLEKLKDEEGAALIEDKYLATKDPRTRVLAPRISLNDFDREYFRKRIVLRPGHSDRKEIKPTKDSHRKIDKAANVAKKHVAGIVSTHNQAEHDSVLMDWIDFMRDEARIILVTVPDYADAFVIFETLNDRGLELSTSDLLKNYLFGKSGDKIAEVQQRWFRMIGAIETVGVKDMNVAYIRQLWSSHYGVTRERELFTNIKRKVNNKQRALDFAEQLAESAPFYAALLNADQDLWTGYGTKARKHVRTLHLLRVEQARTLLLAVLKHFNANEVKKTLRLLVNWSVRFLIAGGSPGKVESSYAVAAVKIREEGVKTAADLSKLMVIVPDDETFENAFALARVSKSPLARYYLRSLEQKAQDDPEPEMLVNDEEDSITLEHILPQSVDTQWDGIEEEEADSIYKRIGNMVLLKGTVNNTADRENFKKKATQFAKSAFLLTQQVAKDYNAWGLEQIADRQKKLAKLAVKTWPLDVR